MQWNTAEWRRWKKDGRWRRKERWRRRVTKEERQKMEQRQSTESGDRAGHNTTHEVAEEKKSTRSRKRRELFPGMVNETPKRRKENDGTVETRSPRKDKVYMDKKEGGGGLRLTIRAGPKMIERTDKRRPRAGAQEIEKRRGKRPRDG